MKTTFIIPPTLHYIEPYAYVEADKSNTKRPYLGLLYIAAVLRQRLGIEARIIDCNIDGLTLEDLTRLVSADPPDIVGFSVTTFSLLNCLEVSRALKSVDRNIKVCFGGWHPTLYPRETLNFDAVDFIVIGEGEYTFAELVAVLQGRRGDGDEALGRINGLGFKTGQGDARINPPREPLKELDQIPFPAYDLVDVKKYSNLLACTGDLVTIITSRGCPQRCVFCDLRRTPYRFRSPENVLEEIRYWAEKGVREFFIQDDNFTINRRRTIEFCRLLTDAGLNIKYKISSRVDYIDDELSEHLKRSGCYRIYFGVESGSQRILDYLEKGLSVEDIKKGFESAKRAGIDCCAYIMIGVPSETRQDIDMTIRLLGQIKPDHLHCSICTPMPRTALYSRLMEDGTIAHDYWLDFAVDPDPSFKTPFASGVFHDQELRKMQNAIQKDFYFNLLIIIREIVKTRSLKQFISKTRMALKILFR
ncbi:MAG: radical SAM protein [Syntrophorhabdus sp.]|nr:radical SAM protein [Syntrophorhabdus sp.]